MISETAKKSDYKIALVDDDESSLSSQAFFLENEGFSVVKYSSGEAFLEDFTALAELRNATAVLVLDILMEPMSGAQVFERLRSSFANLQTQIVVHSAKDVSFEKIRFLKEGASDFIPKTTDPEEFVARIWAHYRAFLAEVRAHLASLNLAETHLDRENLAVRAGNGWVKLSKKEFRILEILAGARGGFISHKYLQEQVFGYFYPTSSVVRTSISRLKKRVEKEHPEFSQAIINDRYAGYAFLPRAG